MVWCSQGRGIGQSTKHIQCGNGDRRGYVFDAACFSTFSVFLSFNSLHTWKRYESKQIIKITATFRTVSEAH